MFSFEKKIPKVYLGIPSHLLFGSCLSRTEERAYPSRFGVPKTTNMRVSTLKTLMAICIQAKINNYNRVVDYAKYFKTLKKKGYIDEGG